MNAVLSIPPDGPLFEGHFPGRPILPGIAELLLLARALAPAGDPRVSGIPFARFRGLVQPGDRLDVSAAARAEGGLRFEVRRDAALVANGALVFGAPAEDDRAGSALAARAPRGVPPLTTLIPHRPPMLFVERVLGEADDGMTCVGRVPHACALVASGVTPAFVALELAAQTAAVWEALLRSRAGGAEGPVWGYLVSITGVTLYRRSIPADSELIASVRQIASAPPLTSYAVEVIAEGAVALAGTIGTYRSEAGEDGQSSRNTNH